MFGEATTNSLNMNEKFKVGDTVRLKSGGPLMTITQLTYAEPPNFICRWFEGDKMKQDVFPPEGLLIVDSSSEK